MASVVFENVVKRYGDAQPVIRDLSLRIEDEEFLVLVGPSGCGKSTALRMIAGLEEITAGKLYIGSRLVNDIEPKERDIAMVFQNYALYPHMSCFENMGFALKLKGVKKSVIEQRVRSAAQALDIEHLLERRPKQLSGGQRQRVAIGRAIVREPSVFLMDEPLSNLDAKLRVSMRAELKKLHQKLGTTFVYVTHDQTEAMTLGSRIAVLRGGDLMQCDSPRELFARPANVFVATFIGSPQMNLLEGEIALDGEGAIVRGAGFSCVIDKRAGLAEGRVLLGVRPEHVGVDPVPGFEIRSKVEVIEPVGAEAYVYLTAGDGWFVGRLPIERLPETGAELTLHATADNVHLFDPETEERL